MLIAARLDPKGEAFAWISCVAYAIIAGLVSRMLILPTGTLAVYFRLPNRNLFAGVLAGAPGLGLIRIVT